MERKVPVLDLYAHFNAMPVATRDAMLVDGIHFNAAGNEVVDEQIRSKIETEFPALAEALQVWQVPAASKYVAEDPYSNSTASFELRELKIVLLRSVSGYFCVF
jgi:hypothetical protein